MYLVLVEEFVNQWISSVNARFVMLDPLGSKFPQYVMSLRFESVSLLSSSWPVLCDVPRPCRGVVGPMDFFFLSRTVVVVPGLRRLVLRWWRRLIKDVSISR